MSGHVASTRQSVVQGRDPEWDREFAAIMEAYEQAGGDVEDLQEPEGAMAVVSSNRVLGVQEVEGVHIDAEELADGIRAVITVEPGTVVETPVHLCFGVVPAEGLQRITSEFDIGADSQIDFQAHCTFPNSVKVKHVMEATVHVGPGATMRYTEGHYHGKEGGIEVLPTTHARVDAGGRLEANFDLTHGRVGDLNINFEVDAAEHSMVELTTRTYGFGEDDIKVSEVIRLNGEGARGITKTRVAVKDQAHSTITTTAEGNAAHTVGHMDCIEVVRDEAVARNIPVVVVTDDQARVTHEAAIGSVNSKEMETLMSRGLDEDSAVDVIIRGMLA